MGKEKLQIACAGAILAAILIFAISFLMADENYEDCLLKRIKGSESEAAVIEIQFACNLKIHSNQSMFSKFNEYLAERSLSKCGLASAKGDWYPPIGHVVTKSILNNLKNAEIKIENSRSIHGNTEISFQNNNNFSIDKLILGFQSPHISAPLIANNSYSKNSVQPFSPDEWLENQKRKLSSPKKIQNCIESKDKYDATFTCSARYLGVKEGKFGELVCDSRLPERLVGMDVCIFSAGPKLDYYSTTIFDFAKSQKICN